MGVQAAGRAGGRRDCPVAFRGAENSTHRQSRAGQRSAADVLAAAARAWGWRNYSTQPRVCPLRAACAAWIERRLTSRRRQTTGARFLRAPVDLRSGMAEKAPTRLVLRLGGRKRERIDPIGPASFWNPVVSQALLAVKPPGRQRGQARVGEWTNSRPEAEATGGQRKRRQPFERRN